MTGSGHLAGRTVAVIGGGIGGLTAALTCQRRGAHVTIHEAAPEIGEVGAGIQIAPNAARVFERLGLLQDFARIATRPDRVDLLDARSGALLATVPLGAAAEGRYGIGSFVVHRADLARFLYDAARARGVDIRLGARISDELPEADVVIAADGVKSALRQRYFDGQPPVFSGCVAWRALIPWTGAPVTRNWLGRGFHVVTYPLRRGDETVLNIVAIEETDQVTDAAWSTPGDIGAFQMRFGGGCDGLADVLSRVTSVNKWGLFTHPPLSCWAKGRLALLGDAAHPMLPFLAQGAAMAIEDAEMLAACLDHSGDVETALRRYESSRLDRATRVQNASARARSLYHMGPPFSWGRNIGMKLTSRLSPGFYASRMDWIYCHDPRTDPAALGKSAPMPKRA